MENNPKIYSLSHGSATKYFWFDITEDPNLSAGFVNQIKSNDLIFKKYSGTTEAACHGSTMALCFFSEEFISLLEAHPYHSYKKYPITFDKTFSINNKYYYIEPTSEIPSIRNQNIFKEPDLKNYCRENQIQQTQLLDLSGDRRITPFYADFSKWNGDDILTVNGTTWILITNELKNKLEKSGLKNLKMKEIHFHK